MNERSGDRSDATDITPQVEGTRRPTSRAKRVPGVPRWVKLSVIAGGLVVLLAVLMIGLGHGPWQQMHPATDVPSATPAPKSLGTVP